MNQAHLHLLINHLAIFGSILGALVLVHGLWTKSNQTIIAGYNLLIISAIGAVITYLTGEGAEEIVENIKGISKDMLDEHEDAAVFALIAFCVTGVASLAGIYLTLKKSSLIRTVATVTLLIALFSFAIVARTGYIGGMIRHTEINSVNSQENNQQEKSQQSDDD